MYNVIYMVELVDCQSQYHCHCATSHVQGYRQNNAFMTTQGPLENTVEDLWRMVWEMNSHTIVMLCGLREDNQVRDAQVQSMDILGYAVYTGQWDSICLWCICGCFLLLLLVKLSVSVLKENNLK